MRKYSATCVRGKVGGLQQSDHFLCVGLMSVEVKKTNPVNGTTVGLVPFGREQRDEPLIVAFPRPPVSVMTRGVMEPCSTSRGEAPYNSRQR